MSDIKFFLKLFAITVVMVLVMQIQIGDDSIETHAMEMIHDSALFAPVNRVANGATKAVRDVSGKLASAITKKHGKHRTSSESKPKSFKWFSSEPEPSTDATR